MTVTAFITLLAIFSTITGVIVEGIKKILDAAGTKYEANIVACIAGGVVGVAGSAVYYAISGIPFDAGNIVFMAVMGIASAIGSMVGYDKVIQTIEQIKNK